MSFYDQDTDPDPQLGGALRDLPVPDHEPGFWIRLNDQLQEVARRPTVAVGHDEEEPPVASQPAEVLSLQARRDLERRTPRLHRRPRLDPARRRRVAAVGVAAAVVLVLAGALAWRVAELDDDPATTPASGAAGTTAEPGVPSVTAATQAAAWRGTLEVVRREGPGGEDAETTRYEVAATANGGLRVRGDDGSDQGFDPATGVSRQVTGAAVVEVSGLPADPFHLPARDLLWRDLSGYVAARAEQGDPAVAAVEEQGRPAWRLATALEPNVLGVGGVDHVEVVVDRELLVPLRLVASVAGEVREELSLTLEPTGSGAPVPLLPDPPAGATVRHDDDGWRPGTEADADLVPATLPEGFGLAAVSVADETSGRGAEGANPRAQGAVQLVYRRGAARVVVTTWAAGGDPQRWSDPFGAEGVVTRPFDVLLDAGALAGTSGHLVFQPERPPHLWAVSAEWVVTVHGDLPPEALGEVASSLAPTG